MKDSWEAAKTRSVSQIGPRAAMSEEAYFLYADEAKSEHGPR